jgi:hypothetical protein
MFSLTSSLSYWNRYHRLATEHCYGAVFGAFVCALLRHILLALMKLTSIRENLPGPSGSAFLTVQFATFKPGMDIIVNNVVDHGSPDGQDWSSYTLGKSCQLYGYIDLTLNL